MALGLAIGGCASIEGLDVACPNGACSDGSGTSDARADVEEVDGGETDAAADTSSGDARDATSGDARDATSGDASDGGADGAIDSGPSPMVAIATGGFLIDTTEVTQASYAAFLADPKVTPVGQAPECAWNTSFAPLAATFDPANAPYHPVTGIDVCDAIAFCQWAGKSLCRPRPLGSQGAVLDTEWYFACTKGGTQEQPYGDAGQCNTGTGAFSDVGSYKTCVGGFPGIFDMVGNAGEWVDSCETTDAGRRCLVLGGSATTSSAACWTWGLASERMAGADFGFRCCRR